jgi:hypothetical protein
MQRTIGTLMVVAAVLAACATGSGSPTGSADGAASSAPPSMAAASDPPMATTDASEPSADGGGTAACDLLTPAEIAEVVGNPVEAGTGTTASDCLWGSDPEETSAAVLILQVPAAACESALETDAAQLAADGFGVPAFWLWAEASGGVGTMSLCTASGMVTVTVSAGLSDTPDEAAIRQQASALADLVLTRV